MSRVDNIFEGFGPVESMDLWPQREQLKASVVARLLVVSIGQANSRFSD